MKYYDLSRPLGPESMVWPGAETPVLAPAATLEADGFRETELKFLSHTGTHMDAPAHMLKDGATLEDIPVEQFFGRARVMDCRNFGPGSRIEASDLPPLEDIDFLLLATGWEEKWGSPAYFGPFPVLSRAASEKLAGSGLKGVGVDAMSVDPMDSREYPVHKVLLGAVMVILENLAGLGPLLGREVELIALPMKYTGADGAPVRVVAGA